MSYKLAMNKTKIKNEIKSEHKIFKGKIIKIINNEVQSWSDYYPQPTEFEFIAENALGEQITVTGCFREIYIYPNQEILLLMAPSVRVPEKFSLTVLIDLKLELLWRELFLDCGSNTIKESFFSHFAFMSKIFAGLSIIYFLFCGKGFYTYQSYQFITMFLICWGSVIGYLHRYLYREAIYFDAIFEMIGLDNAKNIEISEFSLESLGLKIDMLPNSVMLSETFSLKTIYQMSEKKGYFKNSFSHLN